MEGIASLNRCGALLERFWSHPLPVGTPASRPSRPPGTLPLATPDARYGPRSAQPFFRHSLEPSVDGPFRWLFVPVARVGFEPTVSSS